MIASPPFAALSSIPTRPGHHPVLTHVTFSYPGTPQRWRARAAPSEQPLAVSGPAGRSSPLPPPLARWRSRR